MKKFLSFLFIFGLIHKHVNAGADVENFDHPKVDSRNLGPMMESSANSRYSYGSSYSSQGGGGGGTYHKPYGCITCGLGSNSRPSGYYNSGRNFGSSYYGGASDVGKQVPAQSSHHQKIEKQEYVDGQQVYDLHHEKEYKDGRLVKDNHREKTPQDFGVINYYKDGTSHRRNYNARPSSTAYFPSTGGGRTSSSSYHRQYSSSSPQPQHLVYNNNSPKQQSSISHTVPGEFNNLDQDTMKDEMEKMMEDLERKTEESLHKDRTPGYYGNNHRTEVRTQTKYVNGKPIYVRNEERKYKDGKLVHNDTREQGARELVTSDALISPQNGYYAGSHQRQFTQTHNRPLYSDYRKGANRYSGSSGYSGSNSYGSGSNNFDISSTDRSRSNLNRYNSGSTGYQRGYTEYGNKLGGRENGGVSSSNQIPRKVYKTEVGKEVEKISSTAHQPSLYGVGNHADTTGSSPKYYERKPDYTYYPKRPSVNSTKSHSSSYFQTSGSHQYMPGISSYSSPSVDNFSRREPIYQPAANNRRNYKESRYQTSQRMPSSSSMVHESQYSSGGQTYNQPSPNIYSPSVKSYTPGVYSSRRSETEENRFNFDEGNNNLSTENDRHSTSETDDEINQNRKPHEILPGVISLKLGSLDESNVVASEEERYDISPLVDGDENDEPLENSNIVTENYYHVPLVFEEDTRRYRPSTRHSIKNSTSRDNYFHTTSSPSNWIETKTTHKYVNGKLARVIEVHKYYENGMLVHENSTEKTRDQMANEGSNVYDMDLSNSQLLSYGPSPPTSVHSQRHEVYEVQRFENGLPIYELQEEKRFQDGNLVHESRDEKNEDDFLSANRQVIESQNNKFPRIENDQETSRFNTHPQRYVKKHEVHQEEEYINGQKIYDLHHEREFHDGNLVRDDKKELGPVELGTKTQENSRIHHASVGGGIRQNYATGSQQSLMTGCITCGNADTIRHQSGSHGILGSLGIPTGNKESTTYREDVNVEEHYENGQLVKGIEDNKKWKDGVLTDANTDHYSDGPSRTSVHMPGMHLRHRGSSVSSHRAPYAEDNDRLIHVSRERNEECIINPCLNGGTCKKSGYNPVCICKFGFRGSRCEETYCPSRYCRNGGICSLSGVEKHDCDCLEGFTGDRCSTRIYKISVGANG